MVRRQTPWFASVVDENRPELGPPTSLLNAIKSRQKTLVSRGIDDVTAHNRAMVDVDYVRRYQAHLESSAAPKQTIEELRDRLHAGERIALVCYENTDEKHCHRTHLRKVVIDEH